MTDGSLAGYDAVVTGAGRGLGRGVARVLAREGMTVWICADVESELEGAQNAITAEGGSVHARLVDLADPVQCDGFASDVASGARKLRTIVNNAAVLRLETVAETSLSDWERTLAVNLTAPFLLTRELLPHIDADGGSVINVSSMAGVRPTLKESAYCASKFGIEGFTRCLALELEGSLVSANTVTPGLRLKPTSLTEVDSSSVPNKERASWREPETVGPAFIFLAGLRGGVQGCRFDAARLTEALAEHGRIGTLHQIRAFDESKNA